ncbi:hypothetical protein P7K49_017354 [Saguinus oedipus]|uniref:Uncharacterized protein n=1 Tax=Saguinus oedipus TaxID=9490 RepID=A0ABQ9V297_SAGOE|nr:hypothetical protein P7K49_017354 [Saguinus oedipus]
MVLALGLIDLHLMVEQAVLLSRLEEEHQIQKWGNIEWAHDYELQELSEAWAAHTQQHGGSTATAPLAFGAPQPVGLAPLAFGARPQSHPEIPPRHSALVQLSRANVKDCVLNFLVFSVTCSSGIPQKGISQLSFFETQRNGLVFIYDMCGSNYANFELNLGKKVLNLLKLSFSTTDLGNPQQCSMENTQHLEQNSP